MGRQPRLFAGLDVLDLEVAAIDDDIDGLNISEFRVKLRSLLLTALMRPVHRQQLAPKEVEPPAQQHELTKHRTEGRAIVAPEVGDGPEVRL